MGSSHPGVDIAMTHTPSRMRTIPSSDTRAGHDALRIAIIAPRVVPLPPTTYAGTERIVASLAKQLSEAGGGRGLISICAAGGQGVVAILEA